MFDAKKAFGNFKVGGYSIPKLSGGAKPKTADAEAPVVQKPSTPPPPKNEKPKVKELTDAEKLAKASENAMNLYKRKEGKEGLAQKKLEPVTLDDLFGFDSQEIQTGPKNEEEINAKIKEKTRMSNFDKSGERTL